MVATDAGSAVSTQATEGDTTASDTTTSIERVVATTDHKVVGRLFVGFGFLALMFSLVGAALAQLGGAADPLLGAWSQGVGTSSSLGIITMGILPVSIGLGLYLVPLQIGSKSSSFPRGALLAFWTWAVSSVLFVVAILNDGGIGGRSDEMSRLGLTALAGQIVALALGLIIVMTTAITLRTTGMNLHRLPLLSFSFLVTGFVWIVTLAAMGAELIGAYAMRPTAAGLREALVPRIAHIGWAPTALAVAIPALGVIGDVVVTQSGRRLLNRDIFQDLIALFGVSTIGVWALDPTTAVDNAVWTIMAAIALVSVFGYLSGLAVHARGGEVKPSSALMLAGVSAVLLLISCISGIVAAINNFGSSADGTLGMGPVNGLNAQAQAAFAIASAVAALVAAVFHWGPKLFGGAPAQSLGGILAPAALLGGVLAGAGGVLLAIGASVGSDFSDIAPWLTASGMIVLGLVSFMAVLATSRGAASAEDNPWGGQTLEWATTSPPPVDNFPGDTPVVLTAAPLLDADSEGGK